MALDGVYVRGADGELVLHLLGEPTRQEVAQAAAWTHEKLLEVLDRHGRSLEGVDVAADALRDEQPVLASFYGASTADVQLLGDAAGSRIPSWTRSRSSSSAWVAGASRREPIEDRPPEGCSSFSGA